MEKLREAKPSLITVLRAGGMEEKIRIRTVVGPGPDPGTVDVFAVNGNKRTLRLEVISHYK